MQINRNNYENFFLLYVDGELNASDMKAVEDFTAANPDLLHELELLKETVLPADEILFDKSLLFKGTLNSEIPQEKLLLKIDNELPEDQLAALNSLLATDKTLSAEYDLLTRTKLDADEKIVFEDKHLLYRRERDNVVAGRFFRWAAAAILIGFGLFLGYNRLNKTEEIKGGLANQPVKNVKKEINPSATNPSNTNDTGDHVSDFNSDGRPDLATTDSNPKAATPDQQKKSNAPDDRQFAVRKNSNDHNNNVSQPYDIPAPEQQVLPGNKQNNISQPALAQNSKENMSPEKKMPENPSTQIAAVTAPKKTTVIDENIVQLENTYAHVASLTDADKSENRILYMDEDEVKRSKAGGLLRKFKRFVERTAKIKPGNSLRVGSFQFGSD